MEIAVLNLERLIKPGMFIRAHIEVARHDNTTVVPVAALTKRNNQQGVFLVDTQNMKAHFVPVTLGIVNGESAEVVKPSLSGSVVTLGYHLLEDGSAITLPAEKPERSSPGLVNPDEAPGGGWARPGGKR